MQTFLPLPSFVETAKVLDYRRLGKQRVEAMQVLNILRGHQNGWSNHPAVKMWRGYDLALTQYINAMIDEWVLRGYKNNMHIYPRLESYLLPAWFGDQQFHASHRSNLLRKKPDFYSKYGWSEVNNLPYIWPNGIVSN